MQDFEKPPPLPPTCHKTVLLLGAFRQLHPARRTVSTDPTSAWQGPRSRLRVDPRHEKCIWLPICFSLHQSRSRGPHETRQLAPISCLLWISQAHMLPALPAGSRDIFRKLLLENKLQGLRLCGRLAEEWRSLCSHFLQSPHLR